VGGGVIFFGGGVMGVGVCVGGGMGRLSRVYKRGRRRWGFEWGFTACILTAHAT